MVQIPLPSGYSGPFKFDELFFALYLPFQQKLSLSIVFWRSVV